MRVWINVIKKVMRTDANKVVISPGVPIAPPEPLEITDDPWATIENIQYVQYTEETLDGQRQIFSEWGQRPGEPNDTVDIIRQQEDWSPDPLVSAKEAGSWMLHRQGPFGDWYGYKSRGTGPEGLYVRFFSDADPDPATLTVARA